MSSVNPSPIALPISDAAIPQRLREIPQPPPELWVRGSSSALQSPILLAVVGTRRTSNDGLAMTRQIVGALNSYAEVVTVSGLAIGIDATVHKTAVEAGRPTIAVLAGGVDEPTPWTNRRLADHIVQTGGCIVSEFAPGETPFKGRFLQRNRIISGLAQATLVVEAGDRSGALSTAFHALDQNREVLAVPGSPFHPQSAGCNRLIKKGAIPVTSPLDVIEALGLDQLPFQRQQPAPADDAGQVLHHLQQPRTLDQLTELCTMALPRLSSVLTLLELDGRVLVLPDGRLVAARHTR